RSPAGRPVRTAAVGHPTDGPVPGHVPGHAAARTADRPDHGWIPAAVRTVRSVRQHRAPVPGTGRPDAATTGSRPAAAMAAGSGDVLPDAAGTRDRRARRRADPAHVGPRRDVLRRRARHGRPGPADRCLVRPGPWTDRAGYRPLALPGDRLGREPRP